uniref:XK-related protein n=1 Tax=Neogobius melanostomus TaxID=47308 RepID=A0A8C6TTI0_9GOBI
MPVFRFSRLDFFLTCLGLISLLLDVALDAWAVVEFFKQQEWVRLGLLVFFLLGSSLLVQAYSWLWYKYEDFERQTRVERAAGRTTLKALHVLQLGTYIRHMGVVEVAVQNFCFSRGRGMDPGDVAVYLSHDVAMLRIVETFSESVPQLVLMVTTNIQRGHLDAVTVLKSVGSALAVSFCVTSYHRSLRHFLKDKRKQNKASSVVYFLWNLLLIAPRVAALSLFASVLPCFVIPHFLCSWALLVFCAWRAKTSFMDEACGERLYRATVGLIWYFSWFNVSEGRTLWRTLLYHVFILSDIALLCGLWFWKSNPDIRNFNYEHLIAFFCIVFVYVLGLLLKTFYYHCFHPNVTKDELKTEEPFMELQAEEVCIGSVRDVRTKDFADETDMVEFRSAPAPPASIKVNKRMMKLANNFYS